ncbi:MAG TPA: GAF domain-containing protein, partial [Chlamydiales bacterium]|nr:GAF domain-containing protein [Chlamydiales bacterium]
MFLATFFGFVGGSFAFLPVYNSKIFPYGVFFVVLYPALMTYAIIKHQLLDIEVIIRRTAVFAGLFAFVYGIFTVVTVIGQGFFESNMHWNQWVSMIPTVLIITFTLRPLENLLTNATEKFLFQKKYDYKVLLKTFTNEVLTVLDLQKLTEQTISGPMKIMKLESAAILLFDREASIYRISAASGIKDKAVVFKQSDAVVSYLKQTHQPILKDKSADQMDGHSGLRDDFKKLNAQLCLPIAHHDALIGILALGMKKSGEEFTPEDIDILTTLARTLGIAIANARLFDQLSKTQAEAAQREKMAVIGTLAAGINHEICNPLGIVRGQCEMFLLNLMDGIYNSKTREEICQICTDIMNKVIKETDRATGITKKLSGFAKPSKKNESEEVFIEKEAEEVLGLIGHDLKLNNIVFSQTFAADFPPIFADKRQIQEVLFNI